jgi:hypothetical protein
MTLSSEIIMDTKLTKDAMPRFASMKARVVTDFQDLLSLHIALIKSASRSYLSKLLLVLIPLVFGGIFMAFGLIRIVDGLVASLIFDTTVDANQFLTSGAILIAMATILLTFALFTLAKSKHAFATVFYEINEEIQWMKKIL